MNQVEAKMSGHKRKEGGFHRTRPVRWLAGA